MEVDDIKIGNMTPSGFKKMVIGEGGIVKAVFYATTVSILASTVASMLDNFSSNANSIWFACAAFLFYTGYLFDDVVYAEADGGIQLPFAFAGWVCFIVQAVTIKDISMSVVFMMAGLAIITAGMLIKPVKRLFTWWPLGEKVKRAISKIANIFSGNIRAVIHKIWSYAIGYMTKPCTTWWIVENVVLIVLLLAMWFFGCTEHPDAGDQMWHFDSQNAIMHTTIKSSISLSKEPHHSCAWSLFLVWGCGILLFMKLARRLVVLRRSSNCKSENQGVKHHER